MEKQYQRKRSLARDTRGATMVEYLIIIAVVGVASITAWSIFGDEVRTKADDQSTEVRALPN